MADQGLYMAIVFDTLGEMFVRRLANTPVEAVRLAVSGTSYGDHDRRCGKHVAYYRSPR